MATQLDVIARVLTLSKEISELESLLPSKAEELARKYAADYTALQKDLRGYLMKIGTTVETVCNLYRSKARFQDRRICLSEGVPVQRYTAEDACAVAIKAGNEGITFLSAIIKKVNVDVSLKEFAVRYNTVVEIFENADSLREAAVASACKTYTDSILAKKTELETVCRGEDVESLIARMTEMGNDLRKRVMIEDSLPLEKSFGEEISFPVGYESEFVDLRGDGTKREVFLSLLDWSLHKDGILRVRANETDIESTALSSFVVNTTLRFLFAYPTMSKRILICDSCSSNTVTTFAGILKNGNPQLFYQSAGGVFVKNTDEDIRVSLMDLNRTINQRIMTLGTSGCQTVLEYNSKNTDNAIPLILVVMNGYPFKYENAGDEISDVLKNGRNAGVFFLITENTYTDEDSKYIRKRLPELEGLTDNVADFAVERGMGYLSVGGKRYRTDTCGEGYNVSSLLDVFKETVKTDAGKCVYLDSVVEKEDFASSPRRRKYAETLSIPFGKQGAIPMSINLNADGPDAHLALIGISGSGKTAFLNSLILSACKLYSPEELEFHLIIMTKSDFKIFEDEALPHLKTVVTGNRIFAANDILDFIDDEVKRRGELISANGNIYAYNEIAETPLSRWVIVIDEFYQLVQGSSEAVDRINRIAQVGRAYGISLVLSSIRFPMEVSSMLPLFTNRIEFKSGENAGQLIPEAEKRQSELDLAKGRCFFSHRGNVHYVSVAYSEEGERLKAHIAEVKEKYPHVHMDLHSKIRAVSVASEQDAPFATKGVKAAYKEGILRTRLGRTYLSDHPLEYPFDSKNNLLFLFGHYLDTKMMEASLIKDALVLSADVSEPTVYYLDCNKNATLKRAKTVIKSLRDGWLLSGKMVYSGSDEVENTLSDLRALVENRQEDEECAIDPILVVIARGEELLADEDRRDELLDLITLGKENNVYFVIQCNEPVSFYGSDRFVCDAIIFPDHRSSTEDSASSVDLCAALEKMPAGSTEKGRKLIANLSLSALDPKLHLLCNNNKLSIFIPYAYDEEYLKNVVE